MEHCRNPCTEEFTCTAKWTDQDLVEKSGTCDEYYHELDCLNFQFDPVTDCRYQPCDPESDLCWFQICDHPSKCLPQSCEKRQYDMESNSWLTGIDCGADFDPCEGDDCV